MKESINLIGELFGHVCQHELFKCVQILNMANVRHEKLVENLWFGIVPVVEHK